MFDLAVDDRLSSWAELRKNIEDSQTPLEDVVNFWTTSPFTAYNHHIDPFYVASWPTPWEIIVENKYDDFTRAVMIGYSLLLTNRYKDANIQIKTLVDTEGKRLYNVVYVDDSWVLNYKDQQVVSADKVPSLYSLENLVELKRPR
jgi:hypothetical protein